MSCSEKQISFCDSCKLNPSWCKSSNFYLRGQNMVNINQPSDWSKILRYDLFNCRKCDGQSGPIGTPYSYAIYITQVYFAFAITSVLGSKWIQLKVLVLTWKPKLVEQYIESFWSASENADLSTCILTRWSVLNNSVFHFKPWVAV